jgi:hypothetical protein
MAAAVPGLRLLREGTRSPLQWRGDRSFLEAAGEVYYAARSRPHSRRHQMG